MEQYTQQDRFHPCQMEHSMQCHPLALENSPSMVIRKVGTLWGVFLTLIEVSVTNNHNHILIKLEMSPGLVNFFFRLKPLLPYVHFECPVQLAALCTSYTVWLLTCHAEEEKQQHPVQLWQTDGLDDWARSTLCCCSPEGQGLLCLARGNLSAW